MRVLLVSVITENIHMTVLPLGTAAVAAAAREAGHTVRMLSLRSGREDYPDMLRGAIMEFEPEVIGVSLRNIDDQTSKGTVFLVPPVKKTVEVCKEHSHAPVVLGGAGFSIFPESALAYTGADMGIRGEGEGAFVMLLDRLSSGEDPSDVPGLYQPGKKPLHPPLLPQTLDAYPMPLPWVHLEIPRDAPDAPVWVPIQTRRGCPMDCSYCSTAAIEGRRLRKFSPEKVIRTIEAYVDAGVRHFFFVDNTFNLPPSYAEEICDRIISQRLNIRSRCIIYPYMVERRLAEKMAEAGFREVSLGFESGSETVLKCFNKKFSIEDIRTISKLFHACGIFQMGFLMLGGPGETRETVLESLRLMDELPLDMVKITVGIRIYPHTELAEKAIREGRISSHDGLLFPAFYIKEEMKDWLYATVAEWAGDRPNWMT
ncbi:MAG: radical SAM protein [Desulfobacterales bacterium]